MTVQEMDVENNINRDSFDEKSIRMGFIRKVYAILTLQLAITVGIIAVFVYVEAVNVYSRNNSWIFISSCLVSLLMTIVLAWCHDFRRVSPFNLIFLMMFTVCEGVLLGSISSFYDGDEVMIAAGITGIICLGLTIFALQTKWDFTAIGGILFVLLLTLFIFGIFTIFMYSRILNLVYSCVGALLFSVYLVFDTQLMLGGKHKYALSPEEYIFAALNLYLDVVNIFLYILSLISDSD